jgi:hypothetical protein
MLDASLLLFVVWDSCLMCQIWQLGAFATYCLYLVTLYLLIFLELSNSLLVYFEIQFSVDESMIIFLTIIRTK